MHDDGRVASVTRRQRALAALLVVAGVGAVALVAGAPLLRRHAAPPAPGPAVHLSGRPAEQAVQTIAAGRLLFVGASYSIGLGATDPAFGYPDLLADRLQRPFTVEAASGTGFQNPGRRDAGTFAQRIARTPTAPAPRIVIIQGGRDDTRYPIEKEYAAALDTIRLAESRFASAQVVVLGPIPAVLPVSSKVSEISAAIGRACRAARAGYVDPVGLRWITPENVDRFSGHIRGHPNDAGYAYIATKLMGALPAALRAAQPPLVPAPVPTAAPSPSTLT